MPKSLPITTLPTRSLRDRSLEVDPSAIGTLEFQGFLDDLSYTMALADGIGIAAPQVGRNQRIYVATFGQNVHILINPVITKKSATQIESEEGCLSVPKIWGMVPRAKKITLEGLDRHGRKTLFELKNLDAIVAQHELDHLDGILFIDKMTKQTRG